MVKTRLMAAVIDIFNDFQQITPLKVVLLDKWADVRHKSLLKDL